MKLSFFRNRIAARDNLKFEEVDGKRIPVFYDTQGGRWKHTLGPIDEQTYQQERYLEPLGPHDYQPEFLPPLPSPMNNAVAHPWVEPVARAMDEHEKRDSYFAGPFLTDHIHAVMGTPKPSVEQEGRAPDIRLPSSNESTFDPTEAYHCTLDHYNALHRTRDNLRRQYENNAAYYAYWDGKIPYNHQNRDYKREETLIPLLSSHEAFNYDKAFNLSLGNDEPLSRTDIRSKLPNLKKRFKKTRGYSDATPGIEMFSGQGDSLRQPVSLSDFKRQYVGTYKKALDKIEDRIARANVIEARPTFDTGRVQPGQIVTLDHTPLDEPDSNKKVRKTYYLLNHRSNELESLMPGIEQLHPKSFLGEAIMNNSIGHNFRTSILNSNNSLWSTDVDVRRRNVRDFDFMGRPRQQRSTTDPSGDQGVQWPRWANTTQGIQGFIHGSIRDIQPFPAKMVGKSQRKLLNSGGADEQQ